MSKPLSREDEKELYYLYKQTGDNKYRDKIILANSGFIHDAARKYCFGDYDLKDDLIQIGMLSLVTSFNNWDCEHTKFVTYAFRPAEWEIRRYYNRKYKSSGVVGNYDEIHYHDNIEDFCFSTSENFSDKVLLDEIIGYVNKLVKPYNGDNKKLKIWENWLLSTSGDTSKGSIKSLISKFNLSQQAINSHICKIKRSINLRFG